MNVQRSQLHLWLPVLLGAAGQLAAEAPSVRPPGFDAVVAPFLKQHCVACHGEKKQEGKLRLDTLAASLASDPQVAEVWHLVGERLEAGEMPPDDAPRPKLEDSQQVVRWIRRQLQEITKPGEAASEWAFPNRGNFVDHALLFGPNAAAGRGGATPARLWRVSPASYLRTLEGLASQPVSERRFVALPFGLSTEPGFRDYAFRYTISASETEQLVLNAKKILALLLTKRGRIGPTKELAVIADAQAAPSEQQIKTAVAYMFEHVLFRPPTAEEATRYEQFAASSIARLGNRKGVVHGLTPVLLHPEAVFRIELGRPEVDASGRAMLAPLELAMAVSYALTDARPDAGLIAAAREGRLATRDDVRREAERLLADDQIAKPRILRFFQEYFGYTTAPEVFKDDPIIDDAKIGRYRPQGLVDDTDRLVLHILADDRDVLRRLLTTDETFISTDSLEHWHRFAKKREEDAKARGVAPPTHPFDGKKNKLHLHYNFDPAQWTDQVLHLPREQRAGILTQPAWLVAHSTNTDNHAIHRGKWIRERLLGGYIPDTPITVEAKLPEEPEHTLRHRMRVTREQYCWKCHERMDPLGLPFEMFDHFGRHRTLELGEPVVATGEIVGSGEAALDGPVPDAVTLIRKLADSPRVEQVFVRHAFRYFLGRNETPADAADLQAAHAAYQKSGGSMRALVAAILTTDAFLYRYPITAPPAGLSEKMP